MPEHPAPANPWQATCKKARTLVCEFSHIYFLRPSNVMAPELPPSTTVVTPLRRQVLSGFTPRVVAYSYTCVCRSIRPGQTIYPVASN